MESATATRKNQAQLCAAARDGSMKALRRLCALPGLIVDAPDELGIAPIHWASERGRVEAATYLLDYAQADVNARDKNGNTPLHHAVEGRKLDSITLLFSRGATADCTNRRGETPLHVACAFGAFKVAQRLIECGADPGVLDNRRRTPWQRVVDPHGHVDPRDHAKWKRMFDETTPHVVPQAGVVAAAPPLVQETPPPPAPGHGTWEHVPRGTSSTTPPHSPPRSPTGAPRNHASVRELADEAARTRATAHLIATPQGKASPHFPKRTVEQVCAWFSAQGYAQYAPNLRANDIDGAVLEAVRRKGDLVQAMSEIGIQSYGHRVKLAQLLEREF